MAEQVIALIGAGGKTTAMGVLAGQAPGPVLVTTTTHIFPMGEDCLADPQPEELVSALGEARSICAGCSAELGKLKSLPPEVLQAGMTAAKTVIYEGDGAKMHPLKLHRPGEPVLLPETTAVLVVAGLSALGRPIGETVHRYEQEPAWAADPAKTVGEEVFLACVLETVRSARVPCDRIRVYLNQEDSCAVPALAASLCARLRQMGLAARCGSLRQCPPDLYRWAIKGI